MQGYKAGYGGVVVVGGDGHLVFYGGGGGGIDIGSGVTVENIAIVAVVAVENRWFLSHLQRLVLLRCDGNGFGNVGFADGKPLQPILFVIIR